MPEKSSTETTRSRKPVAVGVRATKQRSAISDLLDDIEEFRSAQDLHDELRKRGEGIGLTTVYRTLETLAEVGVVTHVHLASGTAYHLADSAGGMPAHVHAQCRTCHRVIDLPDDVLDDVRRRLDASAGFRLDPHHVALSGLCRDCVEAAVEDR